MADHNISNNEFSCRLTKAADRDTLVAIYRKYHASLFSFAMYYLKSKEDAEDILQDVFVKIWSLEVLPEASKLRGYLFSMVKHRVLNYIRDKNNALQHNYKVVQQLPDFDDALMHYAEKHEKEEKLDAAIEKLPNQQRKVIKLRVQGYSNREIASILNLSLDTVNSHYRACLKNLRQMLSGVAGLITIIFNFIFFQL